MQLTHYPLYESNAGCRHPIMHHRADLTRDSADGRPKCFSRSPHIKHSTLQARLEYVYYTLEIYNIMPSPHHSVPNGAHDGNSVTPSTTHGDDGNASKSSPKRIVTGHNADGKAIVQLVDEGHWESIAGGTSKYNVFWATKTSPVDITHDETLQPEITTGSLTLPNGTVFRIVDRAPRTKGPMHRTQSLDYGVVIEGESELLMDSGDRITMKAGDVCVQRSTMHQWINNTDKWNRMVFILMDALPLEVAGKVYQGETGLDHIKEIGSRT
jgi:quercetin dioxygenase-like cupin family protein